MLKKVVFVVAVMSLVAGCGGATDDTVTPGVEMQLAQLSGMDRIHVFIDPETGCDMSVSEDILLGFFNGRCSGLVASVLAVHGSWRDAWFQLG